ELVVEERRRPAAEYRFRHGLVQEVAYGQLVEAQRRALHLAVGEALEEIHRDSPGEVYGVLARHFGEAGEAARATEYALKAGDAARGVYADEEALDLYDRALAFMDQTGEETRARETLLKKGLIHYLAFDFERASEAYTAAFALPPEMRRLDPREDVSSPVLIGDPEAIVPGHAYDVVSWELCRNLYRGLLSIGPEFELLPDLAETFEVDGAGLEHRFRLRPD